MENILNSFRLRTEKEDFKVIKQNIENGVEFKGTNLWILIFAIFIASLGLNLNSTAVIIGAMLISPLMGPIIGLGLGMAINDLELLKKSVYSFIFATTISLVTSTIYFFLSPINEAHSEILARISPNIYDVFIAFLGGLAGILATSSKLKGNVIPGVAIATALMPPLCTAGYGLATLQAPFFFGAFYLFIINTVFIALATFLAARFLNFPIIHLSDKKSEMRSRLVVWAVVFITLLPSIYFGYDMIRQNRFQQKVNNFISTEAIFPNNFLLEKKIDIKNDKVVLVYGGQGINKDEIAKLQAKLPKYDLDHIKLEVRQGFTYFRDEKNSEQNTQLTNLLNQKDSIIQKLQTRLDSISLIRQLGEQVYKELKVYYPNIYSLTLQPVVNYSDSVASRIWLLIVGSKNNFSKQEKQKVQNWIKIRISVDSIKTVFE